MGRRAALTALAVGVLALLAATGCERGQQAPEDAALAEALSASDRLWEEYERQPSAELYRAFREATLAAARRHTEPHDAIGVRLQVRLLRVEAAEAARTKDAEERARMAFEVIDAIDSIERRDLFRIWDEAVPRASEELLAAREAARALVR